MSDTATSTGIIERKSDSPNSNPSVVTMSLIGFGGFGINTVRPYLNDTRLKAALYFDTSMANTRTGERCNVLTSGLGSGANRRENAKEIERVIPQLSEAELGLADVMVVVFSLAGGSGSVGGPLLIREYARRGKRVIGICVSDTSSSVYAINTLNTLKTLTAVSNNGDGIYLPLVILSNDVENSRLPVDQAVKTIIGEIITLLTQPMYEIDQNDRLNWVDPSKVINSPRGLKILATSRGDDADVPNVVLGGRSTDMVDSTLILQQADDAHSTQTKNMSRMKKVGIYPDQGTMLIGTISSDISDITNVITQVERMGEREKAQTHATIDKLQSTGGSDIVL